jgi:hypothetical protein
MMQVYWRYLSLFFLGLGQQVLAQDIFEGLGNGSARLLVTDESVLDDQTVRRDLTCSVTPQKPALGFDLKFHSGYTVTIPYRELSSHSRVTVVFRVTPVDQPEQRVHFFQRVGTGAIPAEAKGEGGFSGSFNLGEGSYRVDWLLRDQIGRMCSQFWQVKAELPVKNREMAAALPPGSIERTESNPFVAEPPAPKQNSATLSPVKVLLNFAPAEPGATSFSDQDRAALLAILRNVARNPRIGDIALTVFNVEHRQVLYRQQEAGNIDFPKLGAALESFNAARIDMKALGEASTVFLRKLIEEETADQYAAMIFVGPPGDTGERPSSELLAAFKEVSCPLFYMNYNPAPQKQPWPDVIARTVQSFRGRRYSIEEPRDLLTAWPDIIARLTAAKQTLQ